MNMQFTAYHIAKFEHEERIQSAARQRLWQQVTAKPVNGHNFGWLRVVRKVLAMKLASNSLPMGEARRVEAAVGD